MGQLPVIVDTDAGLDDLLALGYLLAHPGIEVEAVTAAYGLAHGLKGRRNLARLLALCGHEHVPVFRAVSEPLQPTAPFPRAWSEVCENLPGVDLPDTFRPLEDEEAESFLLRRTIDRTDPVRILALGALTNLACLTANGAPGLKQIVSMGGAFNIKGNLLPTPDFTPPNTTAEWNYFADPLAAKTVLASELPVTVVPLDATNQVPITPAFIDTFNDSTRGVGAKAMSQVLSLIRPFSELGGFFAWDSLAAVFLTNPEVLRLSESAVDVCIAGTEVGTTRRSTIGQVKQIADWADDALFERRYLQAFA